MENNETEQASSAVLSTAELCLNAETVQCYLYALLDEAKRRGGMYPQTADEQDADSDAIHRICSMVKYYGEQAYPTAKAVTDLHAMRARNMGHNLE